MATSNNVPRRKRGEETTQPDQVGTVLDTVFEKALKLEHGEFSAWDVLARQHFRLAAEGDPHAVRTILRVIKANMKAVDAEGPKRDFVLDLGRRDPPKRSNADLALLILDICAPSDGWVADLWDGSGRLDEERLMTMPELYVQDWVANFALETAGPEGGCDLADTASRISGDKSQISDWPENRDRVVAELMRVRGPGSTRFQPGKSGNRRGRPRKVQPDTTALPYRDFFMDPMTVLVGGKERTVTRLDALLNRLVVTAGNGDRKLSKILTPFLMEYRETNWDRADCAEFVYK